uniref:Putative 8.9 kDa family member n=1 Tax=Rhipicephalus pulchellus TaxID=72859 RepID=L7M918_RHIPC
MKKIVLFLILQSIFLQMLESLAVRKVNEETPRNNRRVALTVKNSNNGCTYGGQSIPPHTVAFFYSPCAVLFCSGPDGIVRGCPAPENTSSSADNKSWPNCCPGWNPSSTNTRNLATKLT